MWKVLLDVRFKVEIVTSQYITEVLLRYFIELQWDFGQASGLTWCKKMWRFLTLFQEDLKTKFNHYKMAFCVEGMILPILLNKVMGRKKNFVIGYFLVIDTIFWRKRMIDIPGPTFSNAICVWCSLCKTLQKLF